jgi:pumilio family protein 6
LVVELFDIITGRVKELVLKHDAVRVIQCAIKYASLDQRKMIARELKGEFVNLSKGRYSKHLIDKLLVHGDCEVQELIVPEFYGNVRRLLRHPEGAWVIDDIYRAAADRNQKAILLREWYGPEFFIFKTEKNTNLSSKLSDLLAENPEKRTPIMRYLLEFINHLVQTNRTAFTMLHDAMLEYFDNVKPGSEEASNFIEVVKGDDEGNLLKSLAFDKSGARVICFALAYGTAKDRKTILKAFKDEDGKVIPELAADKGGYLVLITALEVLDDTVLTTKTLLIDLIGKETASQSDRICQMALHPVARLVFLNLLAGSEPSIEAKAPRIPLPKDDQVFLDKIMQIRSTTSKKAPSLRKQELLNFISTALLATVETMTQDLLADKQGWGCRFITEVLLNTRGDKAGALEAVAVAAEGDPAAEGHASSSTPAGKMYKTLVLGGTFDKDLGKIKGKSGTW